MSPFVNAVVIVLAITVLTFLDFWLIKEHERKYHGR